MRSARSLAAPVVVASLLVLAGCGTPFAANTSPADEGPNAPSPGTTESPLVPRVDQPTATSTETTGPAGPTGTGVEGTAETETSDAGGVATGTVGSTPTATGPRYPPGVGDTGIADASRLVDAHVTALNETGYRTEGEVTTTVVRSGFRVRVDSDGWARVAAGSEPYHERRQFLAGPLNRTVAMYANGSTEYRRRIRNGQASFSQRDRRTPAVLASAKLLRPFLRGGDFDRTTVTRQDNETLFALRANGTENGTAVMNGLPNAADGLRSFEGRAVVDEAGRVRLLRVTVGFTIDGENETHDFSFVVTDVGVDDDAVDRPDWTDRPPTTARSTPVNATDAVGNRRPQSGSPANQPPAMVPLAVPPSTVLPTATRPPDRQPVVGRDAATVERPGSTDERRPATDRPATSR